MLKKDMSSPTTEMTVDSRAGGPDDTRSQSDNAESPTKESIPDNSRAGGPDDTRTSSESDKSSSSQQLPNTPRGGIEDWQD